MRGGLERPVALGAPRRGRRRRGTALRAGVHRVLSTDLAPRLTAVRRSTRLRRMEPFGASRCSDEVMSRDEEFRAFVTVRYAALVRTARLLAADRAQAEDLVQSALLTTYTHWRSIHDPSAAGGYTRTVMVRLAIHGGRRKWRGEVPSVVPDVSGPDVYAEVDDADAARRALAKLPVDQRAVLVLRYYLQLSEAEIADVLRYSPGTVKSRASRALAALRAGGLLGDEQLNNSPEASNG